MPSADTPAPGASREPEASDTYEIDDPAILQLIYDPLRFRLLLLTTRPRTVSELAEAVGMPRGRLYYHVHRLEEHGLLTVADEQKVGTRIERSYRATYSSFRLAPALRGHPLAKAQAPVVSTMHDLTERHLSTLASAMAAPDLVDLPTLFMSRQQRLPAERAQEFVQRMTDLAEEYFPEGDREEDDGEDAWYASLLVVTPAPGPFGEDRSVRLRLDHPR